MMPVSRQTLSRLGPMYCGQSSARATDTTTIITTNALSNRIRYSLERTIYHLLIDMDDADTVVIAVGDVHFAVLSDDAAVGAVHAGVDSRAAVAPLALAAACDRGHDIGFRVDSADGVVLAIDDVDIAGQIAADALGPGEDSSLGLSLVARVP